MSTISSVQMTCINLFFIFMGISLITKTGTTLEAEKIVGGDDVLLGEINYQVSVQINYIHRCGGGIISKLFVLTAALCLIDETNGQLLNMHFSVLFSSNALYPDEDAQRIDVHKAYLHKSYIPNVTDVASIYTTPADIVILELTDNFNMEGKSKIQILKTPAHFRCQYKTFLITGNGFHDYYVQKDEITGQEIPYMLSDGKLRSAEVHVVTKKTCQEKHRNVLHTSKFCASITQFRERKPRGVCSGDSGSPLVYLGNIIYGILVAGSPTCNESSFPGIYTRVSYYRGFIHSVLAGFINNILIRVLTLRRNADTSAYQFIESYPNGN